VRVRERDGRWALTLSTVERASGERRERVLEGTSCDEVTAAAAVALAMVIKAKEPTASPAPSEQAAEPEQEQEPEPAMTPPSPPRPPSASAARPRPDDSRKLGFALSLAGLGDVGALPNAAAGGELGAALDYRGLRISALGALIVGSDEQASGKGADFDLTLGALLLCGRQAIGPAVASLCLGLEAGQLNGAGVGVKNPRSGESFWWAPRLEPGVLWPVAGNFSIFGRFGATLPRIRRTFVLDDTLLVHKPAALTGRLALGVELTLE
jgi:hypothetical protein